MDEFMTAAWEAAESAGTLIRESWQQTKQIHYKSAVELVTSVDRQSESRIVAVLRKRFPGHSILAEEETRITGAQGEYRWIIDPRWYDELRARLSSGQYLHRFRAQRRDHSGTGL